MNKKPIFLSLEIANFETKLLEKLEKSFDYEEYSPEFFEYQRVEVIYVRFSQIINRQFLSLFPNCNFVLCNATGIEHIDEKDCSDLGIEVISLRGETKFLETITATAELTWFLVLALARNGVEAAVDVRKGSWNRNAFMGVQLRGRTLGIAGLGRNGRKLAQYAKAFEMSVIAYDPKFINNQDVEMCDSLEVLCSKSDFVCITAVSNENTRQLFSGDILSKLRPSSFLVNTARGEIIDENFLLTMLETKKIAGYATDVVSNELQYQTNPLIRAASRLNNLLITPHIGGVTQDSWHQTERFVVERMLKFVPI
jgi:D-3-phosphoglycerate dehydrogenase